jgi:NAD(P)-dependent dehydrogenase (short-subunit alcohol dehydrogenase family)
MGSRLAGRVLLVTGAARGIGEHTARRARARGLKLALAGLEPERLKSLAAELDAVWFPCDVTDQAALEAAVRGTLDTYGRLDAVLANAGVANRGTVATGDVEALIRTVNVNLIGVMRTASATAAALIERRGYFLAISSAAAFTALPGMAAYCASKAGVEHFCNAYRLEMAHHGVGVGTAHPSWIDTDLVRDAQDDVPSFRTTLKRLPPPFGTVTSVEKCAAALVEAIERRSRKVYVPRSVGAVQALRTFVNSGFSDRVMIRGGKDSVTLMEAETLESFGSHTAGWNGNGKAGRV